MSTPADTTATQILASDPPELVQEVTVALATIGDTDTIVPVTPEQFAKITDWLQAQGLPLTSKPGVAMPTLQFSGHWIMPAVLPAPTT
jgi:hypothetical protein